MMNSLESVKKEFSATMKEFDKPSSKAHTGSNDLESSESESSEGEQNADAHKTIPQSTRRPSVSAPPMAIFHDEEEEEELDSSARQSHNLLQYGHFDTLVSSLSFNLCFFLLLFFFSVPPCS